MLRKLKIYGVTVDAISWLYCFLTHREQYCANPLRRLRWNGNSFREANAVKAIYEMVKFADEKLLHTNASKTKLMKIHTHTKQRHVVPPNLEICGTEVEA